PRAHHEAGHPERAAADLAAELGEPVARLPGLGEAVGKAEEQVAVARDAEVPAVLADERVQAGLGVAQGQAALGRRVGDREIGALVLERLLERPRRLGGVHRSGRCRGHFSGYVITFSITCPSRGDNLQSLLTRSRSGW